MGPPVKAWNETRNSPDNDNPTSHSFLLTSSLDKTGGRFPPGVADESKTHSPVSHNTSFDNNNTTTFTSDKITSIDKHTTTTFTYTNKLPPSVEATCQKLYQKYGHPVKTYRRWKKSSSQPPIYTPDTTAGHFFWSGCDDDPPRVLSLLLSSFTTSIQDSPLCTSYGIDIHLSKTHHHRQFSAIHFPF